MDEETKPWYTSTAVWASVVSILVGLAASFGFIDSTAGTTITDTAPGIIVSVVTSVLGALALYGRVKATKAITPTLTGAEPKK
jgi:fumarate reductase subunit D